MTVTNRITPCLWFDGQAEEAAKFYTGIFRNSTIHSISRYGEAGREIHQQPAGKVMTVEFEIDGQSFTGLNGGPQFKFSEAISFQVNCETQEEIDYYWDELGAGGDENAKVCGWLKDKFGVSWQIVPVVMQEMMAGGPASAKTQRAMAAMMTMRKLDIAALQRAYDG